MQRDPGLGWGSPDAKDAGRRESPPLRGLTLEPGVEGFVGTLLAWRKGEVRGQAVQDREVPDRARLQEQIDPAVVPSSRQTDL